LPVREAAASSSSDQSESAALCFRSHQDALDFGRHSAEYSNRLMVSQKVNFPELYKEGKLHVVIECTSRADSTKYDLVFFAVQGEVTGDGHGGIGSRRKDPREANSASRNRNWDEGRMSRVTQLVHGPNQVIPSLVRFERQKERKNFIREVCGDFSFHQVFQPGRIVPDGELGLLGRNLSSRSGSGVASLIQNGPQGLKGFSSVVDTSGRQPISELEFVELCDSVSIKFNDTSVWGFFEERFDLLVKSRNVLVCSL
jgi:hypothetical protein